MTATGLDEINERSSCTVEVSFFDEDAAPVTPDAVRYRVDDLASNTLMTNGTIAPGDLDDVIDVLIDADYNLILMETHSYEIRIFTVEFSYDDNTRRGTAEYRYRVKNLYGVTAPSESPSASASPSSGP